MDGCFGSITIFDEKNTILRESSIKEHTHPKLEEFEIEIAKALGYLKYQVFSSILPIPQIYENSRADLTKVVPPNIIAVKFPSYKSVKSQLYYIRNKNRPKLPTSTDNYK